MKRFPIRIKPFGQQAILIQWPDQVDEDILNDILGFKHYLKQVLEHFWEFVPAYNSLTMISQKDTIDFDVLKKKLLEWYSQMDHNLSQKRFLYEFPVCYDLEFGIDLEEVSQRLGLSLTQVVEEHCQHRYTVYGIGFLPGFMYLGGLPKVLEIPRRDTPRQKVEKGAVGLAAKQTGIYPQESPGGWNIIGNCPVPIFNAQANTQCIVNVGDKIQFFPITLDEYKLRKIEGEVGIYQPKKTPIND